MKPDGTSELTSNLSITGNVSIEGNITLDGELEATGDIVSDTEVTAGTISLTTHVHSGSATAPDGPISNTGAPV